MTGPKTSLSLDLRALATFRIGLGLLLITDILLRWQDLAAHYTDFGILPAAPYLEEFANKSHISLHLANGSFGWALLLFSLTLLTGLAVLVGYKTRTAVVIAWLLLISLHNRNPMVLNSGDILFRLLYFWAMFLPLSARYSVDAALAKEPVTSENRYFGGPSIGLTLQIAFIYLATAALKSGREWWPDGTASYYALSLDQLTTSFGVWMVQWTELLRISTFIVFGLEIAVPFLIFCPFYFNQVRTLTLLALAFMHLNFDLTMRLGIFPWVNMVSLILLLPKERWDSFERRIETKDRLNLHIYYDGDAGFCKKVVLLLRQFLLIPKTDLSPASSNAKILDSMIPEHSWVVVDHLGKQHFRFDALVTVLEYAPLIGPALRHLPLRRLAFVGDPIYKTVARCRPTLDNVTAKLLPYRDAPTTKPMLITNALSLFFIGYIGLWNLKTIPQTGVTIPSPWDGIAPILRLDQQWNMFAPYPLKNDGWYVIDGTLIDGAKVDVLLNEEVPASYDKPEMVSLQHANARWRKFMMNINSNKKKRYRLYLGKFLCRSWNEHRPYSRRLSTFEIVFMRERTRPPGEDQPTQHISLWRHRCFKKPQQKKS